MILVKRVYERFLITDGRRVLVDRLWPRGIRRNTPNVDIWLKNVAPSDELRKWYMHDPKKWLKFKERYLGELKDNRAVEQLVKIAESTDPVTLVFASKEENRNNATILRAYLRKAPHSRKKTRNEGAVAHAQDEQDNSLSDNLKKVIIDTSAILFGFSYNRNVFERAKEQFTGYKLTVSRGIIRELTKFSNTNGAKGIRARVALLELKAKKINVDNISVYPDKYILDSASRDRNCVVITNDTILAKKLSLINVKVYKISKSGILKLF